MKYLIILSLVEGKGVKGPVIRKCAHKDHMLQPDRQKCHWWIRAFSNLLIKFNAKVKTVLKLSMWRTDLTLEYAFCFAVLDYHDLHKKKQNAGTGQN